MSATPEELQQQRDAEHRRELLALGVLFAWDRQTQRYVSLVTGETISPVQLREWVDYALLATEQRIRRLTEQLISGAIDFPTWASITQRELKAMNVGLGELAIGGQSEWNASMAGRLGARMRMLYSKLTDLGLEWERGEVSPAQMLNRISMAVHAGRGTFEGMVRGMMMDAGFELERNVLAGNNHCGECPALTDLGWQPIGTMPMIGDRECMTRDLCSMEYSMSADIPDLALEAL